MRFERRAALARPTLFTAVFAAVFAVGVVACKDGRTVPGDQGEVRTAASVGTQAPLVGSESVRGFAALHDTVYARALRGDTLGLLRLFVRDSLYREVVWPTQPSYEPERDDVWMLVSGMNKANSNKGLRRLLADIGEPGHARPALPAFSRKDVEGGALYAREKSELTRGELSLFAAALCLEGKCQVLTYANAGTVGKKRDAEADDMPEDGHHALP